MDYRIGITTRPDARKEEWKQIYPSLRDWVILEKHDSKEDAELQEMRLARVMGCIPSDFGDIPEEADPGKPWCVYRFAFEPRIRRSSPSLG